MRTRKCNCQPGCSEVEIGEKQTEGEKREGAGTRNGGCEFYYKAESSGLWKGD